MPRFYVNLPLEQASKISLPEDVVRHISVLRLRLTDKISLFNGDGYDYVAEFIEFERRKISVKIIAANLVQNESKLNLTLLMSIIASDKFDWVVQKAVELGVTRLIPIYAQNTQRFKADKLASRMEHWRKIILASSEQSGRARLLELLEPLELVSALVNSTAAAKFILSPHHAGQLSLHAHESVDLLVGPEGGFNQAEVELAHQAGFSSWQLGGRILRAETAALSGVSLLQAHFGDFA